MNLNIFKIFIFKLKPYTKTSAVAVDRSKYMNMSGLGDGSETKFLQAIRALPFIDTIRLFLSTIR
jgi:hypothetical protein